MIVKSNAMPLQFDHTSQPRKHPLASTDAMVGCCSAQRGYHSQATTGYLWQPIMMSSMSPNFKS